MENSNPRTPGLIYIEKPQTSISAVPIDSKFYGEFESDSPRIDLYSKNMSFEKKTMSKCGSQGPPYGRLSFVWVLSHHGNSPRKLWSLGGSALVSQRLRRSLDNPYRTSGALGYPLDAHKMHIYRKTHSQKGDLQNTCKNTFDQMWRFAE